jgi:hypothetical protein
MEKMIASRSASDTDFGSFTFFHRKLLLMVGGTGGRAQFWMLRVDEFQHLKMQTIFQVEKRLPQYLPLFFVEFMESCASLVEGALECAKLPLNLCRLHLVHGLDSPRLGWSDGMEQIKNTLASL